MLKSGIFKFGICFALALVVLIATSYAAWPLALVSILSWSTLAFSYFVLSWIVLLQTPQAEIKEICGKEDVSNWILFAVVLVACLTSLVTALFVLNHASGWPMSSAWSSILCFASIVGSWLMVHTSFAFRYAHLFYGDENVRFSKHANGLQFPDDSKPDYLDFAYFSFVIGMTFQVSDVVITGKAVRRLALAHLLIAFAFNTVIIAISISELVNRGIN